MATEAGGCSTSTPRSPCAFRVRLAGEADYLRGEHTAILAVLEEARAASDADALAEALSIGHHCLLPRSTRLGPGAGLWHQIPAGQETLRVHRRFFKDLETADNFAAVA